ncbi:MAG: hypothetical protein OHK0053_34540 [Microscillaceae bacterium]
METLFQEQYALINWYPEKELMCLYLIQEPDFKQFRQAFHHLSENFRQHPVRHLLIDFRHPAEITIEERAWLVTQWFASFKEIAPPILHLGLVTSKSLFEQLNNAFVVQTLQAQSPFVIKLLHSIDEGLKWIETSKHS